MIAILVPSRGRPEQLKRMIESARKTAYKEVKLFLAISPEDELAYQSINGNTRKYIMPDNMPTAHKWNLLAEEAMRNTDNTLFMVGADDMVFTTPGWDEAVINHYNALVKQQHVYHLQDSRDKDGTPHPIMTREYIEAMGYLVPPMFLHWYIDTWTVELAKQLKVFTHLTDYELIHDKPSDRGLSDETFNRIRSFGWRERDEWTNKKMRSIGFMEHEQRRLMNVMKGVA